MPALPSDIGQAIRRARIETWSDAAVKARYPNARDGQGAPAEGFFDAPADGVAAITGRAALFGTERRRFAAIVRDLLWPDVLAGIPLVALIDPELQVDGKHIAARLKLSLENENTSYEVFG